MVDGAGGEHEIDEVGVMEVSSEELDYWIVG